MEEQEPLIRKKASRLRISDEHRRTWSPDSPNFAINSPTLSVINVNNWPDNQVINKVEEHGLRWKYDDYTTIDWIHDTIKDRIRQRKLKSLSGWKNKPQKLFDAAQAWLVLTIVGIVSGFTASLLDFTSALLETFRHGYCGSNIFSSKDLCCTGKVCSWVSWSDISADIPLLIYTFSGLLFALIAFGIASGGPYHQIQLNTIYNHGYLHLENPSSNYYYMYHAAGSGIPEVKTILGGFVIRGFLGLRTLIFKIFSLIFVIAAGLAMGVQGPLVHIACSIGNVTTRIFEKYKTNDAKRREIMSAACAAGVSVAFGAPIGGVLFSLEETSYYFPPKTMWRAFFCALIAAVTLKMINPLGTGKLVMFQVTYNADWNAIELVPFFLLGILGGLFGALFIHATTLIARLKQKIPKFTPLLQLIIIALVTSLVSFPFELTRQGNINFVTELFSDCVPGSKSSLCRYNNYSDLLIELLYSLLIKSSLMIITFGIRVPGGIFIPSMAVGASIGRIVGTLFQLLLNSLDSPLFGKTSITIIPGVYALVGAAGALSGVTRMTVSLAVIMFELTGALTYVLPLMTSIMAAKWVADAFGRDSIYDHLIHEKGYPYLNHKRNNFTRLTLAQDLMETNVDTLDTDSIYRVSDIQGKLSHLDMIHPSFDGGFPVVKSGYVLTGYISQTDLSHALGLVDVNMDYNQCIVFHNLAFHNSNSPAQTPLIQSANPICDLSQWVDKAPLTVSASASCELVIEMFVKLGIRTLLVIRDGVFVGIIHKKRLLSFIHKTQE
ncbi:hypothetical protein HK103_000776 [Boothiomyces macroporosus]|uniref:Chloride channel protein n=1 Tax=Boothiomyces macroporosus TaxID=261099 RepID=A0AAD5UBG5_9FUNG|nr:hypothetical protein HK103_000776 [Boothiomyces macroporosus]